MADPQDPGLLGAVRQFSENTSPIDFVLIFENWELFLGGVGFTIFLVVVALVFGAIFSVPLAIARANRTPIVNQIIWEAFQQGATDIHVDAAEWSARCAARTRPLNAHKRPCAEFFITSGVGCQSYVCGEGR